MPYLSAPEIDQLTLPSNGEYWVKMKRKAAYGDVQAAQSSMINISQAVGVNGNGKPAPEDVITKAEVGSYNRTLLARLIVEWNLTDAGERVLPITEEIIDLLDPQDGEFLAEEASKRLGRRNQEEQVPFGKPSGRRSTATR